MMWPLLVLVGMVAWGGGGMVGYWIGRLERRAVLAQELRHWVVQQKPEWFDMEKRLNEIIKEEP